MESGVRASISRGGVGSGSEAGVQELGGSFGAISSVAMALIKGVMAPSDPTAEGRDVAENRYGVLDAAAVTGR